MPSIPGGAPPHSPLIFHGRRLRGCERDLVAEVGFDHAVAAPPRPTVPLAMIFPLSIT